MSSGRQIRFTKTIIEPACGEHPSFIYASKDQLGEIVEEKLKATFPFKVRTDTSGEIFGVHKNEFEIVKDEDVKMV